MLIQKSGYIKANGAAGYARYIATREGVELRVTSKGPPTPKQKQLMEQLLRDFPDSTDLFEYEDYLASPSAASASAFVSMALDTNVQNITDRTGYMSYISLRPGAELRGRHGLFGREDAVDLKAVEQELQQHNGNVWTLIYSLRREDAARLGYDNSESWRGLLLSKQAELSKAIGISAENLKWYAAFHDAGYHPHVHVMVWSTDPKEGFLQKSGLDSMRSALTNAIYQDELLSLYQKKDQSYKMLVAQARRSVAQMAQQISACVCDNPVIAEKLIALSKELNQAGGKKQYGYLPQPLKEMVDAIVDEMGQLPAVTECYELWNALRDRLSGYYTKCPRPHLLLSQQKEFRAIKNAVIREAVQLQTPVRTFEDEDMIDLGDESSAESTNVESADEAFIQDTHTILKPSRSRPAHILSYRAAKQVLSKRYPSDDELKLAFDSLEYLHKLGHPFAAHLLGKCYRDGIGTPVDTALAFKWFRAAAEEENQYAQYALGKMLLQSGNEKDGAQWLRRSAAQGNPYAQYQMGKLCLDRADTKRDTVEALRFFHDAAALGNSYAQYALGKLYLRGQDVPQDKEAAQQWFQLSAAQGNSYAQFFLDRMDSAQDPAVFFAVTRLLRQLTRTFQDKSVPVSPTPILRIDSKRRRMLMEKRLALGHNANDHEDQITNQQTMQ